MNEQKTLHVLLYWLAAYVLIMVVVVGLAGKLAEAIPVLTNLISGFAGAAFAIMRLGKDKDGPQ
jgi:hypothetical protein